MSQSEIENIKVEKKAIWVLEGPINDSEYLDHSFNSMDKELSWDGYIYVYNNKKFSNQTLEDKIPVQIKGKIDTASIEINRKIIQHSVELDILKNYYNDRGIIFFKIILANNKAAIFYNILYPAKIKAYLDEATRKQNKKQINISLSKMVQNPDEILRICKQFTFESNKQGSGRGQIVPRSINLKDLCQYKNIQATAIGTSSPYEFMTSIAAGDVCFYAKNSQSDIWYPVEMTIGTHMFMEREFNNPICVDGKKFYDKYTLVIGNEGSKIIKLSENLTLNWETQKFTLRKQSSAYGLCNDAEFLLAIKKYQKMIVADKLVICSNLQFSDEFEWMLHFIIDVTSICRAANISIEKFICDFSDRETKSICRLVDIYRGNLPIESDRLYTYELGIDGRLYPFIIVMHEG